MQNSNTIRIIFIGDIVGKPGRRMVSESCSLMKKKFSPDLIIANGENIAGGLGITENTSGDLFNAGIDIITGGNHIFDKREAINLLNTSNNIIRPINYPENVPGKGFCEIKIRDSINVTIVNLQGRVFMEPVADNPFNAIDKWLRSIRSKIVFVDFHAEATAEKQAMGFHLDGRVSVMVGTHTHVPTSDARILANGTAYQTDVGMTGSLDSVIGMKRGPVLEKFKTGINQRWEVAKKNVIMDIAIVDINSDTGRAVNIKALRLYAEDIYKQLS